MQPSITATLAQSEMFDNLTPTQLELVGAICEPVSLTKGQVLFEENQAGDELYVISAGGVEILMNPGWVGLEQGLEPVLLTKMRQGQVLGEMSLVDQGLRSATARAGAGGARLLRISRRRLMLLCETYPELGYKLMKNLAADLALKVRHTDHMIRQYQLQLIQKA